jgi:hypothetical protein
MRSASPAASGRKLTVRPDWHRAAPGSDGRRSFQQEWRGRPRRACRLKQGNFPSLALARRRRSVSRSTRANASRAALRCVAPHVSADSESAPSVTPPRSGAVTASARGHAVHSRSFTRNFTRSGPLHLENRVQIPMPFTDELSRGISREVGLCISKIAFEFQCRSRHGEFHAKWASASRKSSSNSNSIFANRPRYPRNASENDSRLRQNGRLFPK